MSVVRFIPEVDSFALSHPGRRRSNNEDAYLIDRQIGLYIVCDGMGGHAAGEVASSMAVETVHTSLSQLFARNPPLADTFEQRQLLRKNIAQIVFEAGQKIYQAGKNNPNQKGMGTTLTMCLLVGNKAFVGHVGDSRCYLIRNHRTHQLTEDHTFYNEVRKTSGEEAAQKVMQRMPNALSRALGAQPAVQVDTLELDLLPGDRFILCSDGLHGYLDDRNVDLVAFLKDMPFSDSPQQLIHFANQMGGKDNSTVIALQVELQQESRNTQKIRTSMMALRHIHLFQHLDYTEHIELFNVFEMSEFQKGEAIITQGDVGDALFVLVQGNVTVLQDNRAIARLEPGGHFGELALIDNTPRSASVRADSSCLLLNISRSEFEKLISQKPELGVKMMRNLLSSLAHIVRLQSQSLLQYAPAGLPPVMTMAANSYPIEGASGSYPSETVQAPVPEDAWGSPGEFMLPMETPIPMNQQSHSGFVDPFNETMTPGSVGSAASDSASAAVAAADPTAPDPYNETMERNPFQLRAQGPDPFGATAEFQSISKMMADQDTRGESETHPNLPASGMEQSKASHPSEKTAASNPEDPDFNNK